jgi:cytochrome b561
MKNQFYIGKLWFIAMNAIHWDMAMAILNLVWAFADRNAKVYQKWERKVYHLHWVLMLIFAVKEG